MRIPLTTIVAVCVFLLAVSILEAAHVAPHWENLRQLAPLALAYGAAIVTTVGVALGLVLGSVGSGLLVVGAAWLCLGAASIVKRQYLGTPLYPWDLLRLREIVGIWETLPAGMRAAGYAAVAVLTAAVLVAAYRALRGNRNGSTTRARVRRAATGAVVLAAILVSLHPALRRWVPGPGNALAVALRLRNVRWWPEENYRVNGFAAGFLISLDTLYIPRPPTGPSALPTDCDPSVPPSASGGASVLATDGGDPTEREHPARPDVIVVLLESFFDPLTLGVPLSRDPIPFLRTLMAQTGATLSSTRWAHGTANAEFEILTGLSSVFTPPDSVVFIHYLRAPIVSLATEFRRAGYVAEALHPNPGWFYSRSDAYRWLGFERSWFKEDFIHPYDAIPRLSDDRVLFAKMRERLEDPQAGIAEGATASVDSPPRFLWAVTLGTHGPYTRRRAPRCDLRVGGDDAASTTGAPHLESLRIYACVLERLDRRLREFAEWLEARGKPAVLFAYGDHLPALGPELEALVHGEGLGTLAPASASEATPRITHNPLVVWSNTGFQLPVGYRSGFNFLATPILAAADLPTRCQFTLLGPLRARTDFIHPNSGSPTTSIDDPALREDLRRYWSLTYRLLFESERTPEAGS